MANKPIKILLIEDSNLIASQIKGILGETGHASFDVEIAERLSTGLEILSKEAIDIVLLDLGLPDSSGLDTLAAVQKRAPEVPIVVLSSLENVELAIKAVQSGAQDYLIKGKADGDILVRSLRYAIERKRAEELLRDAHDELELRVRERTQELANANEELRGKISEIERARKALRESEQRYSSLFEKSRDGVYISTRQGEFVEVNQTALDLFGYSKQEMIGMDVHRIYADPGDRDKFRQEIEKKGSVRDYDVKLKNKGGTEIDCQLTSTVRRADGGTILGYQGIVRDITERKRAEEALRESEERFRAAALIATDQIYELESGSREIKWFGDVDKMFGYEPGEFPRDVEKMNRHFHPDDRDRVLASVARQLKTGEPYSEEYRVRKKDGDYLEVSSRGIAVRDESGGVYKWIGVNTDITERKRTERALLNAADEWCKTFDSISDMIILVNSRGRITRINNAVSSEFNLHFREILGKPYCRLIYGTETPPDYCPCYKTMNDAKEHTDELFLDFLDRDHLITSTPMFDDNDKLVGSVLILRDITERKKMEEELLKTQKMESLGTLAGGIAHDFNNILAGILINTSYAKRLLKPQDKKAYDLLTEAEDASLRARDLTQQLLTFSKGGAPIRKTASIKELIKDSATFIMRGSNVKCKFSIANDLWPVEVDTGQISQVIHNLVINAQQAMPGGGTLQVKAQNILGEEQKIPSWGGGKFIKLSISDQGIGIPEDHLSKIFDPFFTTKQEGSGLGLATSYSIIKKHEGLVTVESRLGSGTTFNIFLPASEKKADHAEVSEEVTRPFKGKVLVMDDEETIRRGLGGILQDMGCTVAFAGDGMEAVLLYKSAMESGERFDAVILDLTVPGGMGGKEAIKKLQEMDPEVKAVVASGYSNDPVMADHEQYGFKAMIAKPFEFKALNQVLIGLMGPAE